MVFGESKRRAAMTVELIERLQRLGRRPELPPAGATPHEWGGYSEAIQEWRRGFDERWNTFFEGTADGEVEHALRRGIWDRGNACCCPPVLQWAKDYSGSHVAELTRAWLEGWKFADRRLPGSPAPVLGMPSPSALSKHQRAGTTGPIGEKSLPI
jgi:hypothetical protein